MSIFEVKPLKSTVPTSHPLQGPDDYFPMLSLPTVSNFRVGPSMERLSSGVTNFSTLDYAPSNFRAALNFSIDPSDSASSSMSMQNMTDNLFNLDQPTMFEDMNRIPFPENDYTTETDIDNVNFTRRLASTSSVKSAEESSFGPLKSIPESFSSPPAYSEATIAEEAGVAEESVATAGASISALDLAPGIIGSSIINETTNYANQQRTQSAQYNSNFDARLYASMQNSQQSEIAGIGSTATLVASGVGATIGSAFGPLGSLAGSVAGAAIGAGATAIAQHYSNVDPNIINTNGGGMTSADNAA